jgi:DNA adenine methylase
MKYMGNKNRIAKEILPIILKDRKVNQTYVEPFCGGLGTMDKVVGNRIASDKNKYLIAMWQGLQENRERPYQISKGLYLKARTEYKNRTNIKFDDFMIG